MRFAVRLATLARVPAASTVVNVYANSTEEAEEKAFAIDPDTLKWTDDLGDPATGVCKEDDIVPVIILNMHEVDQYYAEMN